MTSLALSSDQLAPTCFYLHHIRSTVVRETSRLINRTSSLQRSDRINFKIIAGVDIFIRLLRKGKGRKRFFLLLLPLLFLSRKKTVGPKDRKGRTCSFVGRTLFHQSRKGSGEKGACVFIFSYENI